MKSNEDYHKQENENIEHLEATESNSSENHDPDSLDPQELIDEEDAEEMAYSEETSPYLGMEDEAIIVLYREGDNLAQEFLISKYKNFVRSKARSYFLIGADKEDIIQEGMIGLYKAIRDFRSDKQASFRAFADLCITRQIITAIKTATRQKHIPLNSYVSLNKPIYDEESDRTLLDVVSGIHIADPEEIFINREQMQDIEVKMSELLSSLEMEVLTYYLEGKSYQEIAEQLERHVKSIDNALQRVKRKLGKYLEDRGGNIALIDCRIRLSPVSAYRSCAVTCSAPNPPRSNRVCYSMASVVTFRHSFELCHLDYRSINPDFILVSIFHLLIQSHTW